MPLFIYLFIYKLFFTTHCHTATRLRTAALKNWKFLKEVIVV